MRSKTTVVGRGRRYWRTKSLYRISFLPRRSEWERIGWQTFVSCPRRWCFTVFFISERGPPPPGVVVAARRMVLDPNDEVQYGDRIPYVIARSATGARLVDRAMDPLEFMNKK